MMDKYVIAFLDDGRLDFLVYLNIDEYYYAHSAIKKPVIGWGITFLFSAKLTGQGFTLIDHERTLVDWELFSVVTTMVT